MVDRITTTGVPHPRECAVVRLIEPRDCVSVPEARDQLVTATATGPATLILDAHHVPTVNRSTQPFSGAPMLSSLAATLMAGAPDAILVADEAGHYVEANPAALALLGYPREELLRLSVGDVVAPGPIWAAEEYSRFLREGQWHGEVELRTKDGRLVPAEARAIVVPGPDGSLYASFVRDITDRRRMEADLRAAEARYRGLVEQLPAVVSLNAVNDTQSTLYVSPKSEALFGYTPEEYLAHPTLWVQTVHPDDRDRVLADLTHMNATGEAGQDEYRVLARDGRVVWVLEDSTLVRNEDGRPLYWQSVQQDVTARKQAEERQRQSEELFRTAFDSAAIGMALIDLDGYFLQVNPALCALTGYTEAELLARTFQDITYPEDLATDLAQVQRLVAGEIGSYQMEKRYTHKTGGVVWGHLSGAVVRDEHGAPLHFIGQIENITDRKEAEEALLAALDGAKAANRAKGVFLDMMSHELRTPLQAVLGYAEFLLIAPEGSLTSEQREDIGTIHRAGGRMIALVNQLLDLSRRDVGQLELASEPVELDRVIDAVRQDIASQAAARGLAVQIEVPASLPPVLGDAEAVRQILLNLVANAVKFTPEGAVCISAAMTSTGGVDVIVSDTGIGIAAEALQHVFEAFHQVESSLTRSQGGSGLGLAIAWQLAEQMGGRISVISEPGIGSTFTLHLPGAPP